MQTLEVPEEFFDVTVDDVKSCLALLKSEQKCLEEAPLVTEGLRQSQMKEKLPKGGTEGPVP